MRPVIPERPSKILVDTDKSGSEIFKILLPSSDVSWLGKEINENILSNFQVVEDSCITETMFKFFGMILKFTVHKKRRLKDHFQSEQAICRCPFLALHTNRGKVNPQEFLQRLNSNIKKTIKPGSTVCIDETIFPTSIPSPSTSYVKRKPHPQGVLSWPLCIETENKKCFVYALACRDNDHHSWPIFKIVTKLMDELPRDKDERYHVVFDSFFAAKDALSCNYSAF